VPGLRRAIANIELVKRAIVEAGDHVVVVGEVLRFAVNKGTRERPLLSVGADTSGYRVLAHEGIHRLAVVEDVR
jgi:flavin reductase (DIM6/NTAB) family NADH-FMN oxidoreductase RutF